MPCTHLGEILGEQKELLKRHLDRHKWYRHMADAEQAKIDFIENFGGLLREMFCDTACPDNKTCESYQAYLRRTQQ